MNGLIMDTGRGGADHPHRVFRVVKLSPLCMRASAGVTLLQGNWNCVTVKCPGLLLYRGGDCLKIVLPSVGEEG